jgi:putative ABC transport system permease protein
MSVVIRGVKNAFRNWLRTLAVVLILAIGIGLSLSMLVANEAVTAKINDLKSQVGTTLTVNPAGSRDGEGGGEPLTTSQVDVISKIAHVSNVTAVADFTLQNQESAANGNQTMRLRMGEEEVEPGKTSLKSSVEPGTLGRRGNVDANGQLPTNFSLPINGVGSQGADMDGKAYNITAGRNINKGDTGYIAVIGSGIASKNGLSVGSTFTAYDKTFTVVGIFDQGNTFANASIAVPLKTAQELNGNSGEVRLITVTVDSVENLESTQAAIKSALGEDKVDVISSESNVQTAIDNLKSVQQISIIAFIGALVAAAVIIFLIMMMIVRERRREIGVLKAIGGSNRTIVSQFIVESLVLVALGTIVGLGVTLVSSGGIANALIDSNSENSTSQTADSGPSVNGMGGGAGPARIQFGQNPGNGLESSASLVGQVAANVGWTTVGYGLLAAIVIAVVGSAIPAWLIAKVRPAEVLRGE